MLSDIAVKKHPVISRDGFIALCVTLIAVLLFTASPAVAQRINPDAVNIIEIHKFEQPVETTFSADGLPKDTSGLTPVSGATFAVKRVPGIDPSTNSGQRAAARMTPDDAIARVEGEKIIATVTTDRQGYASINNLPNGLYLVSETIVPAGYVGAAPFLLALPLTNPAQQDSWLHTVHVYPKGAKVNIALEVSDDHATKVGDVIYWTSGSNIPLRSSIDGYRIEQVITKHLRPVGAAGHEYEEVEVDFSCQDCPALSRGTDYTVAYEAVNKTFTIDFLEPGLHKLEDVVAQHPAAQVKVKYDTVVLKDGTHLNEASVYGSKTAIESRKKVSSTAVTKGGPLSVIVHEIANPSNRIAGARFELYLSKEDAKAKQNRVLIEDTAEEITDENGRLVIPGLRYSGFANGVDLAPGDPRYREYWVVPANIPAGWNWVNTQPLAGYVNSDIADQDLTFLVEAQRPGGDDNNVVGSSPGFIDRLIPPGIIVGIINLIPGGSSSEGPTPRPVEVPAEPQGQAVESDSPLTPVAESAAADRDGLAVTGAQVTGLVLWGGALMMVAGLLLLIGRGRRKEN